MIDRALPSDREQLVALTEATGFFHSDDLAIIREMFDTYVAHPDSDEYTWLVFRDTPGGPPLGFACYGPASLAVGTYDLYWLAVARQHQDKKIGTALVTHMEQDLRARQARQLYIETSDTVQYAPTRAFYERRGYTLIAHFPDYYFPGDGKVIFFKDMEKK